MYPVLATHSIPLQLRVTLFRAIVESRLRYGGEVLGMNKSLIRPLQAVMSSGVKALVGYRSSRNTLLALGPAGIEVGIPPLAATMAVARVRAYLKYQSLRTHVADLLNHKAMVKSRYSWGSLTRRWIKRYGINVESENFPRIKADIIDKIVKRDSGKSLSLRRYQKYRLVNTRDQILADLSVNHWVGLTWLIRFRLNCVWTRTRAVQANLIPAPGKDQCPSCGLVTLDEHSHVLVSCPAFERTRRETGLRSAIFSVVNFLTDFERVLRL